MFTVLKDELDVVNNLQILIEKIANESIAARGEFFVGFSGKKFKVNKSLITNRNRQCFSTFRWFSRQLSLPSLT